MRDLAPYIAGKTGTSEDENDAWFAGFSNEVTVVVWVGYDNGSGDGRRTLGGGETGGHVAVPIFRQIIEASWADYAPRTPLAPPSAEARRNLVLMPVDLASGSRVTQRGPGTITEAFRRDADGQVDDTQYRIVSELDASTMNPGGDDQQGYPYGQQGNGYYGNNGQPYYNNNGQPYQVVPQNPYYNNSNRGLFGGWFNNNNAPPPPQVRVPGQAAPVRPAERMPPARPYDNQGSTERRYDPDYFWNNRTN
jgi:membrane peptidoglycan carboxypeptidase